MIGGRPLRRAVALHVSAELLADLLQLPPDVRVTGIAPHPVRDTLAFRLESERFEPIYPTSDPPEVTGELTTSADGSRVVHWPSPIGEAPAA